MTCVFLRWRTLAAGFCLLLAGCVGPDLAPVDIPVGDGGKKYFAMVSGPARALYRGEALFNDLDYADQMTILRAMEGRTAM